MTQTLPMPITAPLTRAQRTQLVNLVRRASKTEILPRFRALRGDEIDTKSGPDDLVTEADRSAEAMIARGLARAFPGALIVGEESVAKQPDLWDEVDGAELAFIIDPVDGTWNFANGLAVFGVIVSVTRFGRPVFGLLYDPILDDWVIADEESPAEFVRKSRPAARIHVSQGGPVEGLSGYLPLAMLPKDKRAAMAATFPDFVRIQNIRCACHEFRMLAQGKMDFLVTGHLTPWDHAAGVIICRQAGGHVALLDGSEYTAGRRNGYLLAAPDAATWGRLRDRFAFLIEAKAAEDTGD
ncbi:inositol monophosphatase family protein [Primorskyibacter flagellatus]|uniref:inositol monophosphatase family protein n=1 Tax=Primorskyibacter flagellatus TaxID=1387277 RepID=UPI003A90CB7E